MAWPACPERRPRSRGRRTGEPLAASPCKAQGQSADLSHAGLAGTGKASFFPCIRILPALHQIKISLSEGRSCRNFHNSPKCHAVLDRPWEGPYVLIASLLQSGRRQHRRQCQWLRRHAVSCAGTACAWQGKPVESGQSAGCDAGGGLPERAGRARSLPSWEARLQKRTPVCQLAVLPCSRASPSWCVLPWRSAAGRPAQGALCTCPCA